MEKWSNLIFFWCNLPFTKNYFLIIWVSLSFIFIKISNFLEIFNFQNIFLDLFLNFLIFFSDYSFKHSLSPSRHSSSVKFTPSVHPLLRLPEQKSHPTLIATKYWTHRKKEIVHQCLNQPTPTIQLQISTVSITEADAPPSSTPE